MQFGISESAWSRPAASWAYPSPKTLATAMTLQTPNISHPLISLQWLDKIESGLTPLNLLLIQCLNLTIDWATDAFQYQSSLLNNSTSHDIFQEKPAASKKNQQQRPIFIDFCRLIGHKIRAFFPIRSFIDYEWTHCQKRTFPWVFEELESGIWILQKNRRQDWKIGKRQFGSKVRIRKRRNWITCFSGTAIAKHTLFTIAPRSDRQTRHGYDISCVSDMT